MVSTMVTTATNATNATVMKPARGSQTTFHTFSTTDADLLSTCHLDNLWVSLTNGSTADAHFVKHR